MSRSVDRDDYPQPGLAAAGAAHTAAAGPSHGHDPAAWRDTVVWRGGRLDPVARPDAPRRERDGGPAPE
jgi:hypothetical protein